MDFKCKYLKITVMLSTQNREWRKFLGLFQVYNISCKKPKSRGEFQV